MIGIIGPADSVARCLDAARELGVEQQVVIRTYTHLAAVEELTAELDIACPVIVFTGVAPFNATRGRRPWSAHHDYVAYSAADVYQAVVEALVEHGIGQLRFSIDGVGIPDVTSLLAELPIPAPALVAVAEDVDASVIAASHLENLRSGRADCVLTCLSSIHAEVLEVGGISRRIQHGMSTLKAAISAAVLQSQVRASESTQIAVGVATFSGRPESVGEGVHAALAAFADRLRGALVPAEQGGFAIYTTRGVLEEAADRVSLGQSSPFDELAPFQDRLVVSFGIASSIATAEVMARRASSFSTPGAHTTIHRGDGMVTVVGADEPGATADRALPQIDIGPLSFRRLVRALQQLDPTATTSCDLATAYGVTDRSARRLLKRLAAIGVAVAVDTSSDGTRGRPRTVYRVDVDRLLSVSR